MPTQNTTCQGSRNLSKEKMTLRAKVHGDGCDDTRLNELSWSKASGGEIRLQPFDDGHVPETLPRDTTTRVVEYPQLFGDEKHAKQVHCYANAMPEQLVDRIYEMIVNSSSPSWGDYVTLGEIKDFWATGPTQEDVGGGEVIRNDVVSLAARYLQLSLFLGQEGAENDGTSNVPNRWFDQSGEFSRNNGPQPPAPLVNDVEKFLCQQMHGIAVWALAANEGSQVPYHLDYAEQIRYECNIIVPPLLAGTLQCTRSQLEGGDFYVSLDGIAHYEKHGYKAKKEDINLREMIHVPYEFNQLTCHVGHLPHASSRVDEIHGGQLRVIVGFNVFGHDVGSRVEQAPEHSQAFRRKVQTQRWLASKKISLQTLQGNKPLTKLLVLAKREKIKREFSRAQAWLSNDLENRLPAQVQVLMDHYCECAKEESLCWPASPTDVQVFLHHGILEGKYRVLPVDGELRGTGQVDSFERIGGLVSAMTRIDVVRTAKNC